MALRSKTSESAVILQSGSSKMKWMRAFERVRLKKETLMTIVNRPEFAGNCN